MADDDPDERPHSDAELAPTLPVHEWTPSDLPAHGFPTGAERYAIRERIGRGGMGDVLVAIDGQLGREVAVKEIRFDATPDALARFVHEAQIQGRLDHPAIPAVHEIWTGPDGTPRFAMKRLIGTTLADTAGHTRNRLLDAFVSVCFAVEYAHTRGIIHCDLKPANLMLGEFGEVYVLDWGLARVTGDAAPGSRWSGPAGDSSTIYGTPGYIAPERLRSPVPPTPLTDIYALGCILFEILTGERLHRGAPLDAVASTLTEAACVAPSARRSDVPVELDVACLGAIAIDPARRTSSARLLGEQVQRYLDGDRDLEQRRRAAGEQIAVATAALARGDGENERRIAMRAAGRALALDPDHGQAAVVIGRLMLEPSRTSPRAVDDAVAALEDDSLRQQTRVAAWNYLAYLIALPGLLMFGSDPWQPIAVAVLAAVLIVQMVAITRQKTISARNLTGAMLLSVGMMVLLSYLFTPYLVGPALALGTMAGFALQPRAGRLSTLFLVISAGALSVLVLETLGAIEPMAVVVDGALVLRSPAVSFTQPHAAILLAVYMLVMLSATGIVIRRIALAHRDAQRALQLQAWHLKQLMPSDADPSVRD